MEVKLENLSKVFPGSKNRPATVAVNNMNLTIPDGKLVGLLGPSGCGKSTTLYMIAGLHKATEGKIYFGDLDVTGMPPEKRGIGLVFQNYALYPHLTVRQNIMFPLENIRPKLSKETMYEITNKMAALVDIGKYLERKPKELSGGQQQRVAIARALAKTPKVLLLDEPLSNLDARLRLQTREEIRRIQRETGITTIFVTHDQEEAMSISDFIVVMCNGVIQQVGEPQYVYDEPANLFVAKFLGSPAINVFDGKIKNNKLYINNKILDSKGYEGKDDLDLGSEDAYEAFKKAGFNEEYNDFLKVVYNYDEENVEKTETIEAATEETQSPKVYEKGEPVVDLEIQNDIIQKFVDKNPNLDVESINDALNNVRIEKKLNRPVKIAVRPEMFVIDPKGRIPVKVAYVEHIGRDMSIVGNIDKQSSKLRIIISSEMRSSVQEGLMMLSAKRLYVFEETGERIK